MTTYAITKFFVKQARLHNNEDKILVSARATA